MDLKDTIIKQLAAPVKRKGTQDYMTDEEGNIVTSEAAIGMTIVQKALSGDLQAVAFVLNLQMQQQRDPKTEAEDADRRRQQTEANRNEIRRTLEADNLWTDSLALDLDELAQQKTFIDRLTEQMQAPNFQDTFTVPKKDGTMIKFERSRQTGSGVSQRAKTNTNYTNFHELSRNYDIKRIIQTNGRADLPHTHCGDW